MQELQEIQEIQEIQGIQEILIDINENTYFSGGKKILGIEIKRQQIKNEKYFHCARRRLTIKNNSFLFQIFEKYKVYLVEHSDVNVVNI